ncbi:MAG: hypothetical protein JST92_11595 [Deltaproteobacteria bacterium]|nr:hypothetical protein [Deltaproteobacteria bacterium]
MILDLLSSLPPRLAGLVLEVAAALPKVKHEQDDDEGFRKLWHWVEDNGEWFFPVLGLAILALVVMALRRGTLSQAEELRKKSGEKEQIIRLMRAKLTLNAETAAAELQVDRFHSAALLEEMTKEGKLVRSTGAGGVQSYRLKGL